MLLRKADSCLVLVDVQEKLTPLIFNQQAMLDGCRWMMKIAKALQIHCLISEQHPRGLGLTVPELCPISGEHPTFDKVHFSCWKNEGFRNHLKNTQKKQIILIGIETHVCMLQTAMDLMAAGYDVFVVVNATGSRFETDYKYGLKRMKQAGVELVTAEMVFFEWLEQAGTEEFKRLSRRFFQEEKL